MDTRYISQEEFELIESYLAGNLAYSELQKFEERLKNDSVFKSKVEELKTTLIGIEAQALKEQLNIFHDEIDNEDSELQTEETKVYSLNWKRLLVAAALIIAAGSFWFIGGNSNDRLYAKYFTPDPGLPTTMSNSDNYEFYEAMVNYKQGDYKTAISKWEVLQKAKPDNDTLNYFIGVAHLANKNENSAVSFLEKVTKNSEFAFIDDAYYYLGLAYLKTENDDKAKVSLQNSSIDNSKALLSELND